MGLGSTFWTTIGVSALWHDLSGLTQSLYSADPDVRAMWLGPCKIYQEPMAIGINKGKQQNNPGFDSGFFYSLNLSTGETLWSDGVFLTGWPYRVASSDVNACYELLDPNCKEGDLVPEAITTAGINGYQKSPYYVTGFLNAADATYPPIETSTFDTCAKFFFAVDSGSWRMWHYSPYAWSGTPPEVVASAAMHAGVDADHIDQTAFDKAHDAYDLSTGDSPWADLDKKWTIYARRLIGTKVSDFLLECIGHSRDLMFVNEAGKLTIDSWTDPLHPITNFNAEDDQIIGVLSHTMTMRHTFNSVRASWGQAARQSWDNDSGGSTTPSYEEIYVSYEPTLETKPNDKWIHFLEDSTSIGKYGTFPLKGKKALLDTRGQPQEVETSSYPFLLSHHMTTTDPYEWDAATDGGGMIHVTNWLTSDAKPRAEIQIRQGAAGFNTGIGDRITDLEITGDGRTIAEARIIEKTYNFDTLQIDSLIMEVPDNT